ncbi:unnamed protein product [Protopolystoma xenopodis]|uniref:Uncharacterized protein n=1 Tax=Protopolystoma xenopodis TaxID=117903 RepID=A0A448WUQ7_9PLAT|nr:unnamed protein product [Protopolystoma xenopodis]
MSSPTICVNSNSDSCDISETDIPAYYDDIIKIRSKNVELSETISLIECPNGTKVYLIIEDTHPDVVVVELCESRVRALLMNEEEIKEQLKDIQLLKMLKEVRFTYLCYIAVDL